MRAFILVILSLLLGISGNRQLANQFSMANMSQTLQVALAQGIMIENIDTAWWLSWRWTVVDSLEV